MNKDFDIAGFKLREALKTDAQLIYNFILEMAEYEHERDEVRTSVEAVRETICEGKYAKALIGEYNGTPMAYAVYFYTYSTYMGKPSLYLEDLYIKEEYRGCGVGKHIFKYLAEYALSQGCSRFDWSCLDWNTNSIGFYLKLGAVPQSERTIYRLDTDAMKELIANK